MRDRIVIDKVLVPYSFDIVLAGEQFNFTINYNEHSDLFTCTLSKNGEVLVYDEPVIYGVELFKDIYRADKFPAIAIVPFDESGAEIEVNYNNFGKTVFLTIDDGGE